MSFANGELFHIEMKNGIFQVLDFYKADENGNIYYFRKVFDGKLNFKVSKAEIVHESWMSRISAKTQEEISEMINMPEVKAILNDLTIERMMTFGTGKNIEIKLCTMDPKKKNKLEKLINSEIQGFINTSSFQKHIEKLHEKGELHIESALVYPPSGMRLYRIEFGRFCDDFDELGNECFREVRFSEVKIHRRKELL